MRITIVANDTRGGVQPYVGLGRALKEAGYQVQAVAPTDLLPMFGAVGIMGSPLSGTTDELIKISAGAAERGTLATIRLSAREMPKRIETWMRETLAGCEGTDVITGGVGGMGTGLPVADKLGVPFIQAHLQPVGAPTTAYPGVLISSPPVWMGGWGNLLSHHLSEIALWTPLSRAAIKASKAVLGLEGKPRSANGQPVLYGFSRHVVDLQPDAAGLRRVTGYWFLDRPDDWKPSPELEAFLDTDEKVVSIGFGSMVSSSPETTSGLVAKAVQLAGVRAVVLGGWGGLKALHQPALFWTDALPHDWLFPRISAIVHHGGAGTTGAALRAGVPSIVVPFAVDQPFWAKRLAALGVSPQPIPRGQLTEQKLADAIKRAVNDEGLKERAAELGRKIRNEDGLRAAVAEFRQLA